jgi:putative SOS response-associated peptidase YedK
MDPTEAFTTPARQIAINDAFKRSRCLIPMSGMATFNARAETVATTRAH